MKHKIGLDFGTTATKIAYQDTSGDLRVFRYPGATGRETIPSVVQYQPPEPQSLPTSLESIAYIPKDKRRNDVVCEYFKVLLPLTHRKQWRAHGWSAEYSPQEATRAYLRQLLQKDPQSFTHEVGAIDTIAVAMPDPWLADAHHGSGQFLRHLFHHDLACSQVRFYSESQCAVAYIAHRYQQLQHRPLLGTLLVCDIGGSGFHAAVCRVHDGYGEVLAYDGDSWDGLGLGGVTFDRLAMATAYDVVHGKSLLAQRSDFAALVRAFTSVKEHEHANVLALLELQQHVPTLSDTPLYVIQNTYALDAAQLQHTFRPIASHIVAVLSRLLQRATQQHWSVDHAVLLGGFSQLPLVQHTVLTHLNDRVSILQLDTLLSNAAERMVVVAYGAALLAQQPEYARQPYPHTIGIFVYRREKGNMVETFVPFIEAEKALPTEHKTHFLQDGDKGPLTLHVAHAGRACFPLYVRWRGVGELHAIASPEVEYPSPGMYHLGLVLDGRGQATLLFKPIPTGEVQTYPVGTVRFDLLVEDA